MLAVNDYDDQLACAGVVRDSSILRYKFGPLTSSPLQANLVRRLIPVCLLCYLPLLLLFAVFATGDVVQSVSMSSEDNS